MSMRIWRNISPLLTLEWWRDYRRSKFEACMPRAFPPTQRPSTQTRPLVGKLSSNYRPTQEHRAGCTVDTFTQKTLDAIRVLDRLYNVDCRAPQTLRERSPHNVKRPGNKWTQTYPTNNNRGRGRKSGLLYGNSQSENNTWERNTWDGNTHIFPDTRWGIR